MKKTLVAIAAAATIAGGLMSGPAPAQARCYGCAVGLGVFGGVLLGSAIANSYPRYAVAPGYVAYPAYSAPGPVACPGGYWGRRPVAFDAWGNPVGWSRPRYFCP